MIHILTASFLGALAGGLALTPLVRRLARRLGYVARPAPDRWHQQPTALLGGMAIAAGSLAGVGAGFAAAAIEAPQLAISASEKAGALGVCVAAFVMFTVGLVDDRFSLRPQMKFVWQVLGGTALVAFGVVLPVTPWYLANVGLTVFWFVAIANAFNLLDNMDGVAAGVAAVAGLFLAALSAQRGAWLHAGAALALSGAALGFLRYNFHPATIFMGDAGSLFLGATLAGLLVSLPAGQSSTIVSAVLVPLTIVAVPILDTGLVSVTRTLVGRSIAQGGRDHSTHRLALLGLGERQVALTMYAFTAACGVVGLALMRLDGGLGLLLGAAFLTALALLAGWVARSRVGYSDAPSGPKRAVRLIVHLVYRRRLAEVLLDVVLVMLAWYGAFRLRFDSLPPPEYALAFRSTLGVVITVKIAVFALFGVYRGAWRYSGILDLNRLVGGLLFSSVLVFLFGSVFVEPLARSHSIIYIDALLTAALLLSARLSFRSLDALRKTLSVHGEPVLIYGAGDGGELALRELQNNSALSLVAVGFIDDDPQARGTHIHGVPVVGDSYSLGELVERYGVRKIVIATRKLSEERRQAVAAFAADSDLALLELDLRFKLVPPSGALSGGSEQKDPTNIAGMAKSPLTTGV